MILSKANKDFLAQVRADMISDPEVRRIMETGDEAGVQELVGLFLQRRFERNEALVTQCLQSKDMLRVIGNHTFTSIHIADVNSHGEEQER